MPRFDEAKRLQFLALIRAGCSRRNACRYVRCDPGTIRYHAVHDPDFAETLHQAEVGREVIHLQHIREAAKRSWRAAAWLLERLNPSEFRRKEPQNVTQLQCTALWEQFTSIVAEHIQDPKLLKTVRDHLSCVGEAFGAMTPAQFAAGERIQPLPPGTEIPDPDFLIPEEKPDENSSKPGTP